MSIDTHEPTSPPHRYDLPPDWQFNFEAKRFGLRQQIGQGTSDTVSQGDIDDMIALLELLDAAYPHLRDTQHATITPLPTTQNQPAQFNIHVRSLDTTNRTIRTINEDLAEQFLLSFLPQQDIVGFVGIALDNHTAIEMLWTGRQVAIRPSVFARTA